MIQQNLLAWCLGISGFLMASPAIAQLVPDSSLGSESSIVTPGTVNALPAEVISGGAQRGSSLFHSFRDFNVGDGGRVYFGNPTSVGNIFTRVTGTTPSNILGTLGVNGSASLFLLNPNGILFGPNARLDIRGSFVASSSDRIVFNDGFAYSASTPQAPPLLTISAPIGLQYGSNSRPIQVQGAILQLDPGQSLALVGGNVSIDGGQLTARGGRIELGGLAEPGTVGFLVDDTGHRFSFPADVQRGDILLLNNAQVDVTAPSGGSIAVHARNVDIFSRGRISAGISENSGSIGTIAGNITVDATGTITLRGSSVIQNIVNPGAIGNAGRITLQANSLNLLSGSQLFTSTFGTGDAGQITVNVGDRVAIDSAGNNASTSGIISSVAERAIGNGGDINITTRTFSISNGAQLNSILFGTGKAGNVTINASESISFDGANVGASGILSAVSPSGRGNAGDINLTSGSVLLSNGAQLNAITRGRGNAGNVTINASNRVSIDGENSNSIIDPFSGASSIFTSVGIDDNGNQAIGNGGNITITTDSLSLTNGGQLNAITRGRGNAGNVIINARDAVSIDGERRLSSTRAASAVFTSVDSNEYSGYPNLGTAIGNGGGINITTGSLFITNGAALSSLTKGQGNAGNVDINARSTVLLDGENSNGGASGIFSSVADNLYTGQPPARGTGGNINLTTGSLMITGGAGLFANTRGQGNAGNVRVVGREVLLDGENRRGGASGIFSSVGDELDRPPTVGNGGNITIVSEFLSGTKGSGVFASTIGQGDAGNISLDVSDRITFDGVNRSGGASGVFSDVKPGAIGNGREIRITAPSLVLTNGARLSTSSAGNGTAGDIGIDTNSTRLVNSTIASDTVGGQGNITLRSPLLLLRRNSNITTNATGTATGGNITLNTVFLLSGLNESNDIISNAFEGSGGRISLSAQNIFGFEVLTRQDLQRLLNTSDPTALDPRRLQSNNITAFSQARPDLDVGTVSVQTPDVDPSRGLVQLPTDLQDTSGLIASTCPADEGNSFAITGRGGLPDDPRQPLMSDRVWLDDRTSTQTSMPNPQPIPTNPSGSEATVEAQGWIKNQDGRVSLVATYPSGRSQISQPLFCSLSTGNP